MDDRNGERKHPLQSCILEELFGFLEERFEAKVYQREEKGGRPLLLHAPQDSSVEHDLKQAIKSTSLLAF